MIHDPLQDSGKIDIFMLLMSGYSQNREDENMFQHKGWGGGNKEIGQSSEGGLSCKCHIPAHV